MNKLLIVDDEEMVTKTLSMLLGLEGFSNVISFNNPIEALKYVQKNELDLIISDFIMPQMNGIDFLDKAKKTQTEISTILLTGYADKENAIRAIGATPVSEAARGGTDGAMLSYKGLPCPNLGTGGYNAHGRYECITEENMIKCTQVVVEIIKQFAK